MAAVVQGVGLGLRTPHIAHILEDRPDVGWFEVLSDNYLAPGPLPRRRLDAIAEHYPLAFHSVGMNLGSADPLDRGYLAALAALLDDFEPALVSDHLCWTGAGGRGVPDLLPMPYTEQTLDHVASRVRAVQNTLGRRILVENASAYAAFEHSTMTEWDFLAALAHQADCDLLLDVNNVYVNARNFGFDPVAYIEAIPVDRVRQLHLAGHEDWGGVLVDTHSRPVPPPVLDLYRAVLRRFGPVPTLVEWDRDIPALDELIAQARIVEDTLREVLG